MLLIGYVAAAAIEGWTRLGADRTEMHVSGDHPQLRAKMIRMYDSWAERCGVLPWPVRRKPGFEPPVRDYPKTWEDLGM